MLLQYGIYLPPSNLVNVLLMLLLLLLFETFDMVNHGDILLGSRQRNEIEIFSLQVSVLLFNSYLISFVGLKRSRSPSQPKTQNIGEPEDIFVSSTVCYVSLSS